jgi:hypothetical protein
MPFEDPNLDKQKKDSQRKRSGDSGGDSDLDVHMLSDGEGNQNENWEDRGHPSTSSIWTQRIVGKIGHGFMI